VDGAHGQYKARPEPDQALGYAPHGEGEGEPPDQTPLQGRNGDNVVLLIARRIFPAMIVLTLSGIGA